MQGYWSKSKMVKQFVTIHKSISTEVTILIDFSCNCVEAAKVVTISMVLWQWLILVDDEEGLCSKCIILLYASM